MGVFEDITGRRYGKWTVLKKDGTDHNKKIRYICKCDCGTIRSVDGASLKKGASTNCGCDRKKAPFRDLTGQKFGRWTAVEMVEKNDEYALWRCVCDCGNEKIEKSTYLMRGETLSCGCLCIDRVKDTNKKHGKSTTKMYYRYRSMIGRCYDKNNKSYERYGGRGITVCDRWLESYENFYNDMCGSYVEGMTIERIDNNKGYSPDNCRWATNKEQQNNKRNNTIIEYRGEKKTLAQWCECFNLNYGTIRSRYDNGWGVERLFSPPRKMKKRQVA